VILRWISLRERRWTDGLGLFHFSYTRLRLTPGERPPDGLVFLGCKRVFCPRIGAVAPIVCFFCKADVRFASVPRIIDGARGFPLWYKPNLCDWRKIFSEKFRFDPFVFRRWRL